MHDSLRPCRINKNRLFPLWGLIRKLPSFDVYWLTYLTRWVWGRTLSLFCHAARFQAVTVASLHELKPKSVLFFSAVLRQVSFGLPRLRLLSGAHVNAVFILNIPAISNSSCFPLNMLSSHLLSAISSPCCLEPFLGLRFNCSCTKCNVGLWD